MTTAAIDRITRSEMLSEQETIRHNLARLVNQITNNGATIVQFLHDTVQGEYPDAKHHHRQQAARDLAVADDDSEPRPKKPKITMKEIINWDIGRLIRQQTHDCQDLVVALEDIMHPPYIFPSANDAEKKYQKAARVRPHHQMSAMKEMVKRGAGSQNPDCRLKTSHLEEKMLQSRLSQEIRNISNDCLDIVPFLLEVIRNPKTDRWNNIIEDPYTQTHRLWAIKHLLWRGVDIPWEHITPDDIQEYYRDLSEKQRQEAARRRAERKAAAQLTPEQEAEILALFEQTQRENEQRQAKNAAKAEKQANKAAKRAAADKADSHDYNSPANRNNTESADNGKNGENGNNAAKDAADNVPAADRNNAESAANRNNSGNSNSAAKDTYDVANSANGNNGESADNTKNAANRNNAAFANNTGNGNAAATAANNSSAAANNKNGENGNSAANNIGDTADRADAPLGATPPADPGPTAVANALARHPNVDLDTALANHHSTAGIPKQNLTHAQIYDAITAEANFQKRQAIIQRRLHPENPDAAPDDNDLPKSRSP